MQKTSMVNSRVSYSQGTQVPLIYIERFFSTEIRNISSIKNNEVFGKLNNINNSLNFSFHFAYSEKAIEKHISILTTASHDEKSDVCHLMRHYRANTDTPPLNSCNSNRKMVDYKSWLLIQMTSLKRRVCENLQHGKCSII